MRFKRQDDRRLSGGGPQGIPRGPPGLLLTVDDRGVWSNADRSSNPSKEIAQDVAVKLGEETRGARLAAQMSGRKFEEVCREFLGKAWPRLVHLRSGS